MIPIRRQLILFGAAAAAGAAVPSLARAQDDGDLPPNVFISPCGQPFRAPERAPYPVVNWFKQANKAGDGKLTKSEFVADAGAFFDILDRSHRGVLDPFDVQFYERRIAPEVLGYRVDVTAFAPYGRRWRAQYAPSTPYGGPGGSMGDPGVPQGDYDHEKENNEGKQAPLEIANQGAAPYSFFEAPEPVTAADANLNGFIKKAEFLDLAQRHFGELDTAGRGYLVLDALPKTTMQIALARALHRKA